MRPSPIARRLLPASTAVLLIVGCSADDGAGSNEESAPSTIATIAAPAAAPTPAPTTAPPTPAPTPTAAPDPAAMLAAARSTLGGTYRFSGTITVNGAIAATAEGDRVGDGSRFDVTANGSTVSYVVLPDGTWVHEPDGAWERLQDPPAAVDPIDALSAPLGVALVSGDTQAAQLDVTVDAAALGVGSDTPVVVHATVQSGTLSSVAFESVQNGATAQIVTTFGPAADATPVAPPA
jgi:hypothetical protein